MKKWLNYLPTLFIITIVISLIAYSSKGSVNNMNYTEFQKMAETAQFETTTLDISDTVIKVEGTYKDKDGLRNYNVIIPNTPDNVKWVTETVEAKGGKVTVANPEAGSIWLTLAGSILPMIILGAVFYFMFSKMGGGGSNKAF